MAYSTTSPFCATASNSISLYFQELRNNYRIFFRNFGSHLQEVFQFFVIIANIHCRTRKERKKDEPAPDNLLFPQSFTSSRLVSSIQNAGWSIPSWSSIAGELVTVFSTVDRDRRSTQYRNRLTIKFHSQVVRNLSTYGDNHTARLFRSITSSTRSNESSSKYRRSHIS